MKFIEHSDNRKIDFLEIAFKNFFIIVIIFIMQLSKPIDYIYTWSLYFCSDFVKKKNLHFLIHIFVYIYLQIKCEKGNITNVQNRFKFILWETSCKISI